MFVGSKEHNQPAGIWVQIDRERNRSFTLIRLEVELDKIYHIVLNCMLSPGKTFENRPGPAGSTSITANR